MREPLKDKERLVHIVEAIDNVFRYTEGKSFEDMEKDDMMCYAVVYNILSVGEAAYHLSKMFRTKHPDTDWDTIIKMRNVLAHDYYKLKIQTVWEVVQHDLLPLKEQVNRYLTETDWDEWSKNEVVVIESVVHKSLIQTATRMKQKGYSDKEISSITGISSEEISNL